MKRIDRQIIPEDACGVAAWRAGRSPSLVVAMDSPLRGLTFHSYCRHAAPRIKRVSLWHSRHFRSARCSASMCGCKGGFFGLPRTDKAERNEHEDRIAGVVLGSLRCVRGVSLQWRCSRSLWRAHSHRRWGAPERRRSRPADDNASDADVLCTLCFAILMSLLCPRAGWPSHLPSLPSPGLPAMPGTACQQGLRTYRGRWLRYHDLSFAGLLIAED